MKRLFLSFLLLITWASPIAAELVRDILTIHTSAAARRFSVEVAITPEQQQQGLMHRTRLGEDEGMLFPMKPVRVARFWMKNTLIPLDVIFIGANERIAWIHEGAVPRSEGIIESPVPVAAVLEIPGGRAQALGIEAGDRVTYSE